MPTRTMRSPERQSEILDVQLLDLLAQIEALLRGGREVQRDALRVRGIPSSVTQSQRKKAATKIHDRVIEMAADCRELCAVIEQLRVLASELRAELNA